MAEKKKRGRKPGFRMSEAHRLKIQNSNILSALIRCAEGDLEMTSTQASVGLGLMKKVMPDLSSVTLAGDDDADPINVKEVGQGAAKLAAALEQIAERSGTSGESA